MHGHSHHETTRLSTIPETPIPGQPPVPDTPIPGQPPYPETPVPGQPPYPETPLPGQPPSPGQPPQVPGQPSRPDQPAVPGQPHIPGVPPLPGQPPIPETPQYQKTRRAEGPAPWDEVTAVGRLHAALACERARRVQAEERAAAAEWRVTLLRGELMGTAVRRWTWPWRRSPRDPRSPSGA